MLLLSHTSVKGERVTIADAGLEDELEDVTPTSLVTVYVLIRDF
jgi:hypothetical protein